MDPKFYTFNSMSIDCTITENYRESSVCHGWTSLYTLSSTQWQSTVPLPAIRVPSWLSYDILDCKTESVKIAKLLVVWVILAEPCMRPFLGYLQHKYSLWVANYILYTVVENSYNNKYSYSGLCCSLNRV